jgi:riboflavin kinase/FMN adenylyltransferase
VNTSIKTSLGEVARTHGIVTIGTFDGVHLGHQALLQGAARRAAELGSTCLVITFEPIPASVLRPEHFLGRICPKAEKFGLIANCLPDEILILTFDRVLAQQSAEEFMTGIARATSIAELWVGEEFALGKGRSGDVDALREIGDRLRYSVHAVARSEDQDGVISSSRVRNAIHIGDVSLANRLLGRPFRVTGKVIRGAQFGRTIGFPTANVAPPIDQVALADGIYASRALVPDYDKPLMAMTYVGTRPSVNTGARQIETHIFDFDADLYDQQIGVEIMQRLRPDAYFPTIDELVDQLRLDEGVTRTFFEDLHHAVD